MQDEVNPASKSSDQKAMASYWDLVDALMGGADAVRAQPNYLPKYKNEELETYNARRKNAKFTNIYRDIVENLAQRPFSTAVGLSEGSAPELKNFSEDVDGRGNHLHVFAGETFFAGINAGIDWILVDYTKDPNAGDDGRVSSRQDEIDSGVRPYWVRIPAADCLAVYSDVVGGREEVVHFRKNEPTVIRDGFSERLIERVRVFDREKIAEGIYGPASYQVWEKRKVDGDKEEWVETDDAGSVSIGVIPITPFITGRRIGSSWQLHPPMRDAAHLQIEHYQLESGLKHIEGLTAFPMVAGNGVNLEKKNGQAVSVPVGPQSVLTAPMDSNGRHGSWSFIETSAASLNFLLKHVEQTAKELRELGRQPLTSQSGNLTVVTTAFAAQKGNSAIQAWALNLKDCLESAMRLTAMWLKVNGSAEVQINTDFDIGIGDDDTFSHVLAMSSGDDPKISREAAIQEAKRRGILRSEYDQEKDLDQIIKEFGDTDQDADADRS